MSIGMFRLFGVIAFFGVLGLLKLTFPQRWEDMLFVINGVMLAYSVGILFAWRIGHDSVQGGLGLRLAARVSLMPLSAAALVAIIFRERDVAMVLDVIWGTTGFFGVLLLNAYYRKKDAEVEQADTGEWFRQTRGMIEAMIEDPTLKPTHDAAFKLAEVLHESSRLTTAQTREIETQIQSLIAELPSMTDEPAVLQGTANHIQRLMKERNVILLCQ